MIRYPVHDIRIAGRTQGVTILRVGEEEKVVAVSRISLGEEDEGESDSNPEEALETANSPASGFVSES